VHASALPKISFYKLTVATLVYMGLTHVALFGQLPMVTFDSPDAPGTPAQNLPGWSVVAGNGSVAANKGYQNTQALQIDLTYKSLLICCAAFRGPLPRLRRFWM
jgi:hypothetical protein